MSKITYRSVNVEKVVASALVALMTTASVIVGVDIAKLDLAAAFALQTGEVVQIVRFRQTTQMSSFLALLTALVQAGRQVEVVLEATGTYGEALREQAHRVGAAIFMMAPKNVHDAKALFDGVASKHDPKDATLLARLRAQGLGSPWKPIDAFRRNLRALVEMRDLHHDPLMQGYSRLEALLARHWPELSSNVDLYQTISIWGLLEGMPDPREIAAQPERARTLLREHSRGALPSEAVDAILRSARETVGVAPTTNEREQVRRTVSEMLRHRNEVRAIDRMLRTEMVAHTEFAPLSRWLSPTTAAVIIACAGDPRDFHHAAAFEKTCGLNLKEHSSGSSVRRGIHITKRGPGRVRKYLYLFALRWMTRDAAAHAWAEHRASWPRKGGKTSAIVALTRKAARAIWHLARGEDYQASKLFDLRRLELTSAAPELISEPAEPESDQAPESSAAPSDAAVRSPCEVNPPTRELAPEATHPARAECTEHASPPAPTMPQPESADGVSPQVARTGAGRDARGRFVARATTTSSSSPTPDANTTTNSSSPRRDVSTTTSSKQSPRTESTDASQDALRDPPARPVRTSTSTSTSTTKLAATFERIGRLIARRP